MKEEHELTHLVSMNAFVRFVLIFVVTVVTVTLVSRVAGSSMDRIGRLYNQGKELHKSGSTISFKITDLTLQQCCCRCCSDGDEV
jgi:hypothetical protein